MSLWPSRQNSRWFTLPTLALLTFTFICLYIPLLTPNYSHMIEYISLYIYLYKSLQISSEFTLLLYIYLSISNDSTRISTYILKSTIIMFQSTMIETNGKLFLSFLSSLNIIWNENFRETVNNFPSENFLWCSKDNFLPSNHDANKTINAQFSIYCIT